MESLKSVVRTFLVKHDFTVERHGEDLCTTVRGYNGVWYVQIASNEDDRWIMCRSRLPFRIPRALRRKAVLLVNDLNDPLILGNFELARKSGHVAFKTSMRLTDDLLAPKMAEDLLHSNFVTFDRSLPGFMTLIHGRRSVRDAVRAACRDLPEPEETSTLPQLPPVEQTDEEA